MTMMTTHPPASGGTATICAMTAAAWYMGPSKGCTPWAICWKAAIAAGECICMTTAESSGPEIHYNASHALLDKPASMKKQSSIAHAPTDGCPVRMIG